MRSIYAFALSDDTFSHLEELSTMAGEDDVDVYLTNLIESAWIDKTTESSENESY